MRAEAPAGSDVIARICRAIRRRILSGAYPPGAHLGAAELAAEFGVSRTPAREALLVLGSEGFVEVIPNRGAHVRSWSQADVDEVFELRALLEPHAAWRAATRVTAAEIDRLEALCAEMERAASGRAADDGDLLAARNDEFHRLIAAISGGRRLERFIDATYQLALQVWTFGAFTEQDMARSMTHHRDLVAAFRAGDAALAKSVMETHILIARRRYAERAGRDG